MSPRVRLARLRARALRLAARGRRAAAAAAGPRLVRGAARVLAGAVPHETIPPPPPLEVGGRRFDVVDDLVAYTGLGRATVLALLARRLDDFRREWHVRPEPLREDGFYYLSSHLYLFANAVHLHDDPHVVEELARVPPPGAPVLDYGGGTGNLALGLAALGHDVDHLELSALQKDFVRFRSGRHDLLGRVRVLDAWEPLERGRYALVCALDVLEHLPDLAAVVTGSLVPALRPGGVLAEQSPFGADEWNPMHHADQGLEPLLRRSGLEPAGAVGAIRLWRSPG